jgi:hypothetical protein
MVTNNNYPVTLTIDYPDKFDRFTTFFRIIFIIPIFIILGLVSGTNFGQKTNESVRLIYNAGGVIFAATLLMIVFRQKYPKWWYDWNIALARFSLRVFAYFCLLRSEYPSTDEEQAVHLEIPYPEVKKDLNRWLPLVKWLLVLPHYIVLAFLYIGMVFSVIFSWFSIIFLGKYPKGLFNYTVGVFRWTIRVDAYAFLLTTDKYPLFSLN